MIPEERQNIIYNLLYKEEIISINKLVELLDVSHMTIRRDIEQLQADGKVTSVRGGVKLNNRLGQELSYKEKSMLHNLRKKKIGAIAYDLIKQGDVVYLDAGTTTFEIARILASEFKKITIITNDFTISDHLMSAPQITLFHTGGKIDSRNRSCVGANAANFIKSVNVDVSFISTSSWDVDRGLSTPDEGKALVKKAVIKSSRRNVLVTDSSKYNKYSMFNICAVTELNDIIVDSRLSEEIATQITNQGITLHIARD